VDQLADELRRSLLQRCHALGEFLEDLAGKLTDGARVGTAKALDVALQYPPWFAGEVDRQFQEAHDAELKVLAMDLLVEQFKRRSTFLEEWFRNADSLEVPLALISAVEIGCADLGLESRDAVLALGEPSIIETFIPDLVQALFADDAAVLDDDADLDGDDSPWWPAASGEDQCPPQRAQIDAVPAASPVASSDDDGTTAETLSRTDPETAETGTSRRYTLMQVPRYEARQALWWPILLGHELMHLRLKATPGIIEELPLRKTFFEVAPDDAKRSKDRYRVAQAWASEVLCDAYMIHRFGPAGAAAMGDFLTSSGDLVRPSETHPPGVVRLELMLGWLYQASAGHDGDGDLPAEVEQVLDAHRQRVAESAAGFAAPGWDDLIELVRRLAPSAWMAVLGLNEGYDARSARTRELLGEHLAQLRGGLPPAPPGPGNDRAPSLFFADAINAGWVCRHTDPDLQPVTRLVAKAIETRQFVDLWCAESAGGTVERIEPDGQVQAESRGVMPESQLRARMSPGTPDKHKIVVVPLLQKGLGADSIDVRLGTRFLIFQRNATRTFVTSRLDNPRGVQRQVEKTWGEPFVLHPGELVLASTLEYLALPPDLTAQVITRSSYGRLGLITATAVQVHPRYHGCLTLELVNLGVVPLELVPGERVAQLVFTVVDPPPAIGADDRSHLKGKYSCPTVPEFSQLREDEDLKVLSRLRQRHQDRIGTSATIPERPAHP
jgi:deoxycytidine triphosphate deaminase